MLDFDKHHSAGIADIAGLLSSGIRSTGIRLSSNRPFLRGQHTKYTWNFQFLNPIKRGRAASSPGRNPGRARIINSGNDECRFSLLLPSVTRSLRVVKTTRNFYTLVFNTKIVMGEYRDFQTSKYF